MPKTYGTVQTFTAGSVLTASSLNTVGTAVNNLVVPSACRIVRTSDASFTSGNAITFQSASASDGGFDTDGMWAVGTPTRITIQTAGIYVCSFCPYITSTGGTTIQAWIRLNGSTALAESDATVAASGVQITSVSLIYSFAAAAYIEGLCVVNGTSPQQKGTTVSSALSAAWIGRTS